MNDTPEGTLIGIGTWIYTMNGAPPFDAVAREVASQGYDGIELDGGEPYFHPSRYPRGKDRRSLVEHIGDLGLRISGYNPPFYEFDITSNDVVSRTAYLDAVKFAADFAADCGIDTIRLDTAQAPPGPAGLDARARTDRVTDIWREAARIAMSCGVKLAWEFEPGFMCNKPSDVFAIVEAIDNPAFGILFDTCHAHMVSSVGARQEDPVETLPGAEVALAHRLGSRVHLVHLIDSDETIHDNFTSTHVPFGHGVIKFPPLVDAIVAAGYRGPWWTVDLCFWPNPADWTRPSLETVRSLLHGAGLDVAAR